MVLWRRRDLHPPPGGSGTGSRLLHYFSMNRVDSRGLRWIPVDSAAADKRLTSNVLDHKLRIVSQLPKHARTGSIPVASKPTPGVTMAHRKRPEWPAFRIYATAWLGGSAIAFAIVIAGIWIIDTVAPGLAAELDRRPGLVQFGVFIVLALVVRQAYRRAGERLQRK